MGDVNYEKYLHKAYISAHLSNWCFKTYDFSEVIFMQIYTVMLAYSTDIANCLVDDFANEQ